ncbi:hypothetical protein DPMN_128425 [Dreissena polymorpha]|uniref:Uncharacterized protein n=1 Tax=Dreissena polymorpha TaxID=45954 RepID=A0A9D4JXD7_DREPO|nr:hypothetical protein DPMN_128425 [Dreissena polymorpha]
MRCERSVNSLHTVARRHLPLVNQADHAIKDLPKHRLYITVPKQNNHHVVGAQTEQPSCGRCPNRTTIMW